jgi:hypothetical protein
MFVDLFHVLVGETLMFVGQVPRALGSCGANDVTSSGPQVIIDEASQATEPRCLVAFQWLG